MPMVFTFRIHPSTFIIFIFVCLSLTFLEPLFQHNDLISLSIKHLSPFFIILLFFYLYFFPLLKSYLLSRIYLSI